MIKFTSYLVSICEANPWSKVVRNPALQGEGEQLEKHFYILHTHTNSTHNNSQNVLQISSWMLTRNVAATFVTDKFLLSWRRRRHHPPPCVSGEPVF